VFCGVLGHFLAQIWRFWRLDRSRLRQCRAIHSKPPQRRGRTSWRRRRYWTNATQVLAIPLVCAPMSAWSQQADSPPALPKSDVAVTYQIDKGPADAPRKLQITYSDAGERVRLDYFRWREAKIPYLTKVFNRSANRLITIYPERKAYTERPVGNAGNPGMFFRENTTFRRLGTSKIANAPCTEWSVEVPGRDEPGDTACVTDDGIALRIASANPAFVTLAAINIHYGPPPDGYFDPPAGFRLESSP
jgi:hypothetical protein